MMGNEFQNKSANKYSFPHMRGREREIVVKWRKVPSHLMYLLFWKPESPEQDVEGEGRGRKDGRESYKS